MIRIVFGLLIPLHGLLHLIGAVYGFRLLYTSQYTGQTTIPLPILALRLTHLLWLLTCLLFLAAAVLFLLKKDWWWMVGLGAVVLSQTLIFLFWSDAKWGTVANGLILLLVVAGYGSWQFNRVVQRDISALLSDVPVAAPVVAETDIKDLPHPVQQWLHQSGAVGKEVTRMARLEQKGAMRLSPTGKWMPLNAQQYITTEKPGFVWVADVKAAPGIHLAGRDRYIDGRGHMLIKLFLLYPLADKKGPEIDQGTLLRYLAEMMWVPSAALSTYIRWQPVDERRAIAIMSYGDIAASGVFDFTAEGEVESFEAMRYYDRRGGATREAWRIQVEPGAYKAFGGVRIPVRATVSWGLKEGDFTWCRLQVTGITYNGVIGGVNRE